MMPLVREWCRHACERAIVLRGLKYAVVVGSILVAINHGNAILAGTVDPGRAVRIGLTVVVPYAVSVLSSVGALRQARQAIGPASPASPRPSSAPHSRSSGS